MAYPAFSGELFVFFMPFRTSHFGPKLHLNNFVPLSHSLSVRQNCVCRDPAQLAEWMSKEKENFWKAWDERLVALRQIPPVLRIVWQSGPAIVLWGIIVRIITALLPIGLLAVSKRIIDNIVTVVERHQPISPTFWWLVAAEFALAVASSVLTRLLDYLDSVLADKYTRHVSIEVMRHAAQLDLIAYEDPVFYDRLERARVQATDRLGMIQSIGRLLQQVVTALSLSID